MQITERTETRRVLSQRLLYQVSARSTKKAKLRGTTKSKIKLRN